MALPVSEGGRVGFLNAGDLEDGVAFAGGSELRGITLLGLERFGDELRAVRQGGGGAIDGDGLRGSDVKVMCGRGGLEAGLGSLLGKLTREVLLTLRNRLAAER